MTLYVHTESYVSHIEPDLYIPGNILFSDGCSLKTTDGLMSSLIAGSAISAEREYIEGVGKGIEFCYITGFAQLTESQVIFVDIAPCLRTVDRKTKQILVLLGYCSGFGQASESKLQLPVSIAFDNHHVQIVVTDGDTGSLRMVDLDRDTVFTLVNGYLKTIYSVFQDWSSADYLRNMTMPRHALATYYYQPAAQHVVKTGSSNDGFTDGPYEIAKFSYPVEKALLSSTTLLMAEHENNRLRFIDLDSNTTTFICTGEQGHGNGDLASCQLFSPQSMLVSHDTLFVGEYKMIRAVRGKFMNKNVYTNSTVIPHL